MEVYYKFTIYNTTIVHFTNSVYMKYDIDLYGVGLFGVSIVERRICLYDDLNDNNNVCKNFIILLNLFEINNIIIKYEDLL